MPPPFDKKKKMVVPQALRVIRLKPGRRFTVLGELSKEFGWRYTDVVHKLEEKRKVKAQAWYARKNALLKLRTKALEKLHPFIKKKQIKHTLSSAGYIRAANP